MSQSIIQTAATSTGAKIYCDTECFTWKKNSLLAGIALLSISCLVLGILAQLHTIAIPGAYAFISAGGGLLVIDAVALLILARMHRHKKALLIDFLAQNKDKYTNHPEGQLITPTWNWQGKGWPEEAYERSYLYKHPEQNPAHYVRINLKRKNNMHSVRLSLSPYIAI